jgi:hypothetical protein
MYSFCVDLSGTTGREKAVDGCRNFRIPVTKPRKIVSVAESRSVQKSVAAPLDQASAVCDGDRSRQRTEQVVEALIRPAFWFEMQVPCRKKHGGRRAKACKQGKRDLPISRGGQRDSASRPKPKRNTIPMWIPVCEGH